MNVRNNREYDAISKEVESQELDTKIFVKKSAENEENIEEIKVKIKETKKLKDCRDLKIEFFGKSWDDLNRALLRSRHFNGEKI